MCFSESRVHVRHGLLLIDVWSVVLVEEPHMFSCLIYSLFSILNITFETFLDLFISAFVCQVCWRSYVLLQFKLCVCTETNPLSVIRHTRQSTFTVILSQQNVVISRTFLTSLHVI